MNKECTLKNGQTYIIRDAEKGDAPSLIQFIESVSGESDNLTFGPGEFSISVKDEEDYIESILKSDNQLILIARQNNRIIANLGLKAGPRPRIAHSGEFGITVLNEFWGNGIASALIQEMLNWALLSPITKINLKVKEDNLKAIELYKKFGFEEEGRLRRDFCINGVYHNSLAMGKLID